MSCASPAGRIGLQFDDGSPGAAAGVVVARRLPPGGFPNKAKGET
jgi:hypothetical protein